MIIPSITQYFTILLKNKNYLRGHSFRTNYLRGRFFYVIDSENLSTGIGLQVVKAAELAAAGMSAFFGSALRIHPRIEVIDGAMHPEKKYRGKNTRYIMDYLKDMEGDLKTAVRDRVFITHSGCDREILDEVREYLEGLDRFDEILETTAGAVISSHCGPGTLGVLFIAQ